MNVILKMAKAHLEQTATIASVLSDGVITVGEILKVKLKGLLFNGSLAAFIPNLADREIKLFEDLTKEEIAFICKGQEIPLDIVEKAYDSAVAYYELLFAITSAEAEEGADLDLPSVPIDKKLTAVNGIGPKVQEILENLGIKSIEALAAANPENLKAGFLNTGVNNAGALAAKVDQHIANAKTLLQNEE